MIWVIDILFNSRAPTQIDSFNISSLYENFNCAVVRENEESLPPKAISRTAFNTQVFNLFLRKNLATRVFVKDSRTEQFLFNFCVENGFDLLNANIVNLSRFNLEQFTVLMKPGHANCAHQLGYVNGTILDAVTCPGENVRKMMKFLKRQFHVEAYWD